MMYYIKSLALALIAAFAISGSINAQHEKPVKFERFTIEDGLSSNRIYSITQDHRGYLWIGTEAGFSRYDGFEFETYRKVLGDENSIINNMVNAIHADDKGIIWIGTQNGLSRYNPFIDHFNNDNSLPGRMVASIYESSTGVLWFGTNNGLALYDEKSDSFKSPWENIEGNISLSGTTINSISEDQNGILWIGTGSMGVILLNPKNHKVTSFKELNKKISFPSENIAEILVASNGEVWMGFLPDLGLGRFNPETRSMKIYTYDSIKQPGIWNRISGIIEAQDHTIWITSYHSPNIESGLHRFDEKIDKFTHYTRVPNDPASLTWPYAQCLYNDRDNNLWVGTSRGLNKMDIQKWLMGHMIFFSEDPFSLLNNFYGIEEIEEDLFWLGQDGEGLLEWDRKTNTKTVLYKDGLFREERIHAIKKDIDGRIWLGLSGIGLIRMDLTTGEKKRFTHIPGDKNSLAGNYVTDILIDRNKQMWVTTSNGLSRYNREDETFTNWRKGEGNFQISGNSLSCIFEDSKGIFWIGTSKHSYDISPTYGTGLIKFNPLNNSITNYSHDSGNPSSISSDVVFSIAEDLDGNIWAGTDHGLNCLNPEQNIFELYLEPDGLPHPKVIGILVDDSGILWLSTLNGLSRFDPASRTFRNFSTEDGVQAPRFNEHSYFKTEKGELIFGGVAGVNFFFPSELAKDTIVPNVYIKDFMVKNQPYRFKVAYDTSQTIKLKWNENSVGWEFVSINFRSPDETQFKYRLDGYQDEWVSFGFRRFVEYTNLHSGHYTFRVRAINAEGISSAKDATMNVRVLPPFWMTWYAYILYAILLTLLIFMLVRIQRNKLMRQERERTKDRELAQAKKIENAYTELKTTQAQLIQSEKMASLGELTAGIAHEIQNPLNFVNNFSEVSAELLDEMIEEIKRGQTDEVKEISSDLKQNLERINHHGKRADSIVKGMLQHSRASDGKKELTDINLLADEYLRLSYHGLRAKDKSFNSDINTNFDEDIPKISIVPQDIGRVILNLLTNAFFAVTEKTKLHPEGFAPAVSIGTSLNDNKVQITIKDNGIGIPQTVLDKIFHPFFTTKPSGQGTGLGLSMSYEIITKGHGGELKVNTKEGEYTEFIILIPVKN